MDMDIEANKRLVGHYFEMWNTGNIAEADEVLVADCVDHAHPEASGAASVKESLLKIRASAPTFHIAIEFMVGEGNLVALRGKIHRTQACRQRQNV